MPVIGKVKQSLSKEVILSKVSEYEIYRFYLGSDFQLGTAIHSPFHKDENPSFGIICTKEGHLLHTDFSGDVQGTCIDFVMQLFSLSFYQALVKICNDFSLDLGRLADRKEYQRVVNESTPVTPKKHTLIQVVSKPFNEGDLRYWNQYHLDLGDLKANSVYSVKKIFLNGEAFLLPREDLTFGYLFEDKWKIYRPLQSRKYKWITNIRNTTMSGLWRMKPGTKRGFVTKSKKDEMVLAKFLPAVCSAQCESRWAIDEDNLSLLQRNCEEVYVNFDNDEVGVKASEHYNQFGFKWVNCPRTFVGAKDSIPVKDFADMARYHGLQAVIDYFTSKNLI